MKKKLIPIGIIILIAVVAFGNLFAIKIGGKVVMTKAEYDELQVVKEYYSKLETLKASLKEAYYKDLSDEELFDGMMHGLFESTEDKYTVYYNEEENKIYEANSSGVFAGIGVELSTEDNRILITRPIKGSPAFEAGIQSNDVIVKVNDTVVTAEEYDKAVNLISGEVGSSVLITVSRSGKEIEFNITRDNIHVEAVRSQMIGENGYINIAHFDEDTYNEFKAHYEQIMAEDAKGLILDLRNNPGGSLEQCVNVADYILGKQTVVYTKDRLGEEKYYRSDPRKIDLPFVVLINGNSASAAEILAAAVRDTEAAPLVGTKSFGKGIVQTVWKLPDGSGYKITTSKYYTPNGENFHNVGLMPNDVIEMDYHIDPDVPNLEEDIQLIKAISYL